MKNEDYFKKTNTGIAVEAVPVFYVRCFQLLAEKSFLAKYLGASYLTVRVANLLDDDAASCACGTASLKVEV